MAHARLYRLIDADEPDLGANIAFTTGRIKLLMLGQEMVGPLDADAALAYVAAAEQVADGLAALDWLESFPDELAHRLQSLRASEHGARG